ncbi:hypothetical protein AFK65_05645 [Cronobacter universalis NCTC 9529]|uniref:Uncharacterized protein n=1 Tax=Cronobacter universalis NCTC 9529 TaxID=1074000 RepID=A0AAC8VNR5_9ENTR|nr:hypothetical protein AFK65_05645 [Cronobacter universalis NCTC 9529]
MRPLPFGQGSVLIEGTSAQQNTARNAFASTLALLWPAGISALRPPVEVAFLFFRETARNVH